MGDEYNVYTSIMVCLGVRKYRKDANAEHFERQGNVMKDEGTTLARQLHGVCNK